jgi:hypothetical protein
MPGITKTHIDDFVKDMIETELLRNTIGLSQLN